MRMQKSLHAEGTEKWQKSSVCVTWEFIAAFLTVHILRKHIQRIHSTSITLETFFFFHSKLWKRDVYSNSAASNCVYLAPLNRFRNGSFLRFMTSRNFCDVRQSPFESPRQNTHTYCWVTRVHLNKEAIIRSRLDGVPVDFHGRSTPTQLK